MFKIDVHERSFVDLAVDGQVRLERIDDFVEAWHHDALGSESLAAFLGLTDEEYALWVSDSSKLADIVAARKDLKPLMTILEHRDSGKP